MAFCPTCGSANSEQAKFCIRCGSSLSYAAGPITIFYSYSHKDEDLRNELEAHLAPLRRSGLIREWHDRKIVAGQDWDKQISSYQSAELILFLISADFIKSNYILDIEVKRALERRSAGQAAVVPVILRPVLWQIIPEFGHLQALPEGARAVTDWPSPDLAFVSVCEGIVAVIPARSASAKPAPGIPVPAPRPTTARSRHRILDAALPERVPLTKPSTLLVLVRGTDSPGLCAIVEAEPEYHITADDIDSQSLSLKFPVDKNGTAQPLELNIRIESPQFEPPSQSKSIRVPPRGDSLSRLFFLTPTQVGDLLVNVEICQGDEMIAGCVLHTQGVKAEPGAEELPARQSMASASLEMTGDEAEHGPGAATLAPPREEGASAPRCVEGQREHTAQAGSRASSARPDHV
jgi:TIR domain-containing protein/zinc ribbon protein